jgi:tetratricopeptide (TPR) repeat protein
VSDRTLKRWKFRVGAILGGSSFALLVGILLLPDVGTALSQGTALSINDQTVAQENVVNRENIAEAFREFGVSSFNLGEYSRSIVSYNEALKIYQELGNRRQQADLLNRIGLVYRALGQAGQAIHSFHKALDLLDQDPYPPLEARIWYNQGLVFSESVVSVNRISGVEFALHPFRNAREASRPENCRVANLSEARICFKIFVSSTVKIIGIQRLKSSNLENIREAIDLYDRLLNVVRREASTLGDLASVEADILNHLAYSYSASGDSQRAIELYRQVPDLLQASGYSQEAAIAKYNLAEEYSKQGNLIAALSEVNEVIDSV